MKDRPIIEIAAMVVFGVLGIITFVAGCFGYVHQLMLSEICAIVCVAAYASYNQQNKK